MKRSDFLKILGIAPFVATQLKGKDIKKIEPKSKNIKAIELKHKGEKYFISASSSSFESFFNQD